MRRVQQPFHLIPCPLIPETLLTAEWHISSLVLRGLLLPLIAIGISIIVTGLDQERDPALLYVTI